MRNSDKCDQVISSGRTSGKFSCPMENIEIFKNARILLQESFTGIPTLVAFVK